MTSRTIQKHLVRFNEAALPNSFVAVGTQLDGRGKPCHAGIIIRLNGQNYLHHFGTVPQVIDDFDTASWFLYKVISVIKTDDVDEVGAFLKHCKRVCDNSNISYSCVLDGSVYNAAAEYESVTGLPELGTCVGFCINTLSLFCIDADVYIQLEEWNEASIPDGFALDNYGQKQAFARYPNIDKELYNAFKKRISPLEYLCSAFFDVYPVTKEQIDGIKESVEEVIDKKFNA